MKWVKLVCPPEGEDNRYGRRTDSAQASGGRGKLCAQAPSGRVDSVPRTSFEGGEYWLSQALWSYDLS